MSVPVRLQLSRRRGFRLQDHSRAINGLPAVVVARPSRWGNPWTVAKAREAGFLGTDADLRTMCAAMFENAMRRRLPAVGDLPDRLHELRGHNLACWCPLDCACHAGVLLQLANGCRP